MKNKIIWIIVVIVVIILVALGVNRRDNNGKIKIGVLTPMSGPIAIAGEVQKNALAMATKDNPNEKIELIYEDSKYDPKTSVSGYETLKMKGAKIIIADGSPVVAAIRAKAVQDGIMIFAQSATTPAFTDGSPLTCRIGLTADILGGSISQYVNDSLKYKRIAIMSANNEYGVTMKDEIKKAFESLGGQIVTTEIYDQASGDLRTNITRLVENQKNIDALIVTNNITPESMFRQLKELGWTKPIVSDAWTITSPNMKDRTVASGVPFIDYAYTPQADLDINPAAANYARLYESQFESSPILLGALTYDSYNILSKAINEVGGNPKKIAEYLPKMGEFTGITGNITFDGSCQNIDKKLVWRKVKTDGMFSNL